MKTYISSDFHLKHENILKYNPEFRQYSDTEEMSKAILGSVNSVCTEEDRLILAGDIGWKQWKLLEFLPQVKAGEIILVSGNHDLYHPSNKKYEKAINEIYEKCPNVTAIVTEMEVKIGVFDVLISHFPFSKDQNEQYHKWRPKKNANTHFLLHGHSHSSPEKRLDKENDSLDIGWDAWGRIVSFDDIEDIIDECYSDWP